MNSLSKLSDWLIDCYIDTVTNLMDLVQYTSFRLIYSVGPSPVKVFIACVLASGAFSEIVEYVLNIDSMLKAPITLIVIDLAISIFVYGVFKEARIIINDIKSSAALYAA
jgi:hypothetical protein